MKKIKIGKVKAKKEKVTKEKKNKNIKTAILSILLLGGIGIVSIILVFALYVIISSPDFDKDLLYSKEATVVFYNDNSEISRFGSENRVLVNYDELPQVLIDAIIATEDSRFFQHSGLDVARFAKATVGQLMGRAGAGGASTITMQIIKKTYTDSIASGIKGLIRKATDIYMAVFKLESNYTKEEILEFYVNSMWFGNDGSLNYGGIYGVEQACQHYFGKSVSDITLAEASIIAGMFQNPRTLNPYKNPKGVRARQNTVLTLMVNHGYITEEEKNAVLNIPIESLVRNSKDLTSNTNQAVLDYVLAQVEEKTGLDPYVVPMKIYTTIDSKIQNVLTSLEKGELYEFPNDMMQEGIAITSVENGSIVALSGGRNYQAKGTNRAVDIWRQPGSSAKPIFDYGPYIEYLNGSPGTLFLDEETTYSNGTSIKNADGRYRGLMTMRDALVNSRNIPALRAFKALENEDLNYIKDFVHSLGIDYGKELYESAAIGGFNGVNPLQMSAAYATFGRGGYYIEPYIYTKIELTETGEVLENKYEKVKAMSEETAYMITDMLKSAVESGVGGLKMSSTDIAAKTGTTTIDEAKTKELGIPSTSTMDAWNITYSPEYAIALWIGYDKLTSDYYLNSTIGGRVRNAVMKAVGSRVYSQNKRFTRPSTVIEVEVEKETFPLQLASEYTPKELRSVELFKAGTEPTEVSTRFSKLEAPTNGSYTFEGSTVTLKWDEVTTPDAVNTTALQEHFNTYYDEHATLYFERRLNYIRNSIGTFGYNIYQKDSNGNLTYIGRSTNNTFKVNNVTAKTTYVIRTVYSLFWANISDGLEITVTPIDHNVEGMVKPEKPEPPTDTNTNTENNLE